MTMSVFESVMRSPSVWTGKDGVNGLDKLLGNEKLQDKIQENLIRDSYSKLVSTGSISVPGLTDIPQIGTVLSPSGLTSIAGSLTEPLKGAGSALGSLSGGINSQLGDLAGKLGSTFDNLSSSLPGKIGQFNLPDVGASGLGALGGATSALTGALGGLDLGQAAGNLSSLASNINLSGLASGLTQAAGSVSALAGRGISELGGLLNATSKVGLPTATDWAKGFNADALTSQLSTLTQGVNLDALTSGLDSIAKQGQFAINFADFKIPNIVAGVAPAAAFEGTVNRATLDDALVKLIGSNKIPVPDLGIPADIPLSLENLQPAMDSAKSLLKSAGGALGQIPSLPGSLSLPNSNLLQQAQSALRGGVIPVPGLDISTAAQQLSQLNATSLVNQIGTATTDPSVMMRFVRSS